MSLVSLQLMYSYLNELALYAGVQYLQPWPQSDITSLGVSVIALSGAHVFYSRDVFGIGYQLF